MIRHPVLHMLIKGEKKVILLSVGITVIKSRETRAVIYTCRYSSGQINPLFIPLAEF